MKRESSRRTPEENATLALLLEVSGTPKPGNVDREHDYPDLGFEQFLAGAVGAFRGLELAAGGEPVGRSFERAIAGMSTQRGGNTQFGAILLLTPLVRAAALDGTDEGGTEHDTDDVPNEHTREPIRSGRAEQVVASTTVDDAVAFYRAFEHVDVAVDDPPDGMEALDVRHGSDAEPAIREHGLTLEAVMAHSAEVDGIAAEWVNGFPRTGAVAERLLTDSGPISERTSTVFLEELAADVDTFVVTKHDHETAVEVRQRARRVLEGEEDPTDLAEEFVSRGINPGTTADIVAGGLFVALERGMEV